MACIQKFNGFSIRKNFNRSNTCGHVTYQTALWLMCTALTFTTSGIQTLRQQKAGWREYPLIADGPPAIACGITIVSGTFEARPVITVQQSWVIQDILKVEQHIDSNHKNHIFSISLAAFLCKKKINFFYTKSGENKHSDKSTAITHNINVIISFKSRRL